jgi:hypothetical protein
MPPARVCPGGWLGKVAKIYSKAAFHHDSWLCPDLGGGHGHPRPVKTVEATNDR